MIKPGDKLVSVYDGIYKVHFTFNENNLYDMSFMQIVHLLLNQENSSCKVVREVTDDEEESNDPDRDLELVAAFNKVWHKDISKTGFVGDPILGKNIVQHSKELLESLMWNKVITSDEFVTLSRYLWGDLC